MWFLGRGFGLGDLGFGPLGFLGLLKLLGLLGAVIKAFAGFGCRVQSVAKLAMAKKGAEMSGDPSS